MKLYHFEFSGHSHRVRLMLSLLDAEYEPVAVDLRRNEHKTAAYLALKPAEWAARLALATRLARRTHAVLSARGPLAAT